VNAAPEEAWLPAPKAFAENADGPDDPVLEPKAAPVPEPKAGAGADAEVEEPNPKAAGVCVLLGGAAPKTPACRNSNCQEYKWLLLKMFALHAARIFSCQRSARKLASQPHCTISTKATSHEHLCR
jgi:hypothetical protein